jgi:hypothetical protein
MTGRSEVKPPNFAIKRFLRVRRWWMGEREDEADAECLYGAGLFTKDHDGEEWGRCPKMSKVGTHYYFIIL